VQVEVEEAGTLDAAAGLQQDERVAVGDGAEGGFEAARDVLGDRPGRSPEALGEGEGTGPRQVSELPARRHLQRRKRVFGSHFLEGRRDGGGQLLADPLQHLQTSVG
jgi:hypothetical protein